MKVDKEIYLFTGTCLFLGLSWTNIGTLPLWWNAVLVLMGSLLAGAGLLMRRQHKQQVGDEREERRRQEWDQTNQLLVRIVEVEHSKKEHIPQLQRELSQGLLDLRKSNEEQIQHFQTSLSHQLSQQHAEQKQSIQRVAEQIITVMENSQASLCQKMNQHHVEHMQNLRAAAEQVSTTVENLQASLLKQINEHHLMHIQNFRIVIEVLTAVEKIGKETNDTNATLVVEQRRIADSITDLESKISEKADQLLDVSKEDQEFQERFQDKLETYFQKIDKQYEEFNETMRGYLLKVKHASEDIEEYREEIEQDLRDRLSKFQSIVNRLEETASQLADSKQHERELALKVQQKLNEQLMRLSSRG